MKIPDMGADGELRHAGALRTDDGMLCAGTRARSGAGSVSMPTFSGRCRWNIPLPRGRCRTNPQSQACRGKRCAGHGRMPHHEAVRYDACTILPDAAMSTQVSP
ncbi:MAG: hypothetical protein V4795_15655 [Pseudomonadota bacterium]